LSIGTADPTRRHPLEPTEPLIHWPQPIFEYLGFLASFLAAGAVGFRFAALRGLGAATAPEERLLFEVLARRAAAFGLVGAGLGAALLTRQIPALAARRHLPVAAFIAGSPPVEVQLAALLVTLSGFVLVLARQRVGWLLAAAGVLVTAFRSAFFGQWARLVNPLHVLGGGLWIGTLFLIVVAGLPGVLGGRLASERKGAMVAQMVNQFSPLALASAGLLATFGVATAWIHLKRLPALWTTPYGYALIVKLCVVLAVVGLGAWNWRRQRPRLGTEAGAHDLRRSATAEVLLAAIVLAVTAILVSLPTPGRPGG
jgi:putative copper export protein